MNFDTRLRNVESDFKEIIDKIAKQFSHMTKMKKGRVFHKVATTLSGTLTILNKIDLPAHAFFVPNRQYPVILRHANGVQDDDAATDNRGATLRILNPNDLENYHNSLLDLLLSTGECFISNNAYHFYQWSMATENDKKAIVKQYPHIGEAAWDMYRTAEDYDALYYYSKVANEFAALDGDKYFIRFRIIPANKSEDRGFVKNKNDILPKDIIPREIEDKRPKNFLHLNLQEKVKRGSINYLLQAQLRKVSTLSNENELALDCTQKWPEDRFNWIDVANIKLTEIVDNQKIENLSFNPINTPRDLALPLARLPTENASLNHLRAIIYELSAMTRGCTPQPIQRVCVIGAGPSGLAIAHKMTQLGYSVTVLEKESDIGGKAQAIQIDGYYYDLGAHVCTQHYRLTHELVKYFNIEVKPDNPALIFDMEQPKVVNASTNIGLLQENILRYRQQRNTQFKKITQSGYFQTESLLINPTQEWIKHNNYTALQDALMMPYTASGYGYLADNNLPMMYLLKFAEQGSLSETQTSLPLGWTIKDGFIQLWRKIAESLPDVRCNTDIQFVERHNNQITVHLKNEKLLFDKLILACPLDASLLFLDATPDEKELFNKIEYYDYYTTVCSIDSFPKNGFYLIKQHCEDKKYIGNMVAFHHSNANIYCCYSYGNEALDGDDIKSFLQQNVEKIGGKITEFHIQKKWRYFPHVNQTEAQRGFFNKLEALQGNQNTYYVGSIFNFELIETNLAYIDYLVNQHFGIKSKEGETMKYDLPNTVQYLKELLVNELNIDINTLNKETEILTLGLDSIKAVEIFRQLGEKFNLTLEPTVFFDHPTIHDLASYLVKETQTLEPTTATATATASAIIIPEIKLEKEETHSAYTQYKNFVYAERLGIGLVMDIFVPKANSLGLGVIDVVSALGNSERHVINNHQEAGLYEGLCRKGFTVFALRPGSSEIFNLAAMLVNIKRGIRFIKHHAKTFHIDPKKIALTGGSFGAYLALMGMLTPQQEGEDPDFLQGKYNSTVQALVGFNPIFDFDHYYHFLQSVENNTDNVSRSRYYLRFCNSLLSINEQQVSTVDIDKKITGCNLINYLSVAIPPLLIYQAKSDDIISPPIKAENFVKAVNQKNGQASLKLVDSGHMPGATIQQDVTHAADWLLNTLTTR